MAKPSSPSSLSVYHEYYDGNLFDMYKLSWSTVDSIASGKYNISVTLATGHRYLITGDGPCNNDNLNAVIGTDEFKKFRKTCENLASVFSVTER